MRETHLDKITCREAGDADYSALVELAHTLPDWFTLPGVESISKDLPFQRVLIAFYAGNLAGFITYYSCQAKAHIGWLAVHPDFRKKRVGRYLLTSMCGTLSKSNIQEVFVSTLSDGVDYPPYAETRAFYRYFGFKDHKTIKHPDNPECEEELILKLDMDDFDWGAPEHLMVRDQAHLEELILERLENPCSPMTDDDWADIRREVGHHHCVIPAKAGIQTDDDAVTQTDDVVEKSILDSRFRGNDE